MTDSLSNAEIARLREGSTLDQRQAAHAERLEAAREDAEVVAAYYKRLKERGVSPAHALTLTEDWQMLTCAEPEDA